MLSCGRIIVPESISISPAGTSIVQVPSPLGVKVAGYALPDPERLLMSPVEGFPKVISDFTKVSV